MITDLPPFLPFPSSSVQVAGAGIAEGSFANDAISARVIAANAIGSSEIANGALHNGAFAADALAGRQIRNFQRLTFGIGDTQASTNNAISAVTDMTKTTLTLLGWYGDAINDSPRIRLTSTTNIIAERSGTTGSTEISCEVIEWY